jgi:3-mercaptopyruvate sulfurtransferase SseA
MSSVRRWSVIACLVLAGPARAANGPAGNLVDADWLSKHLGHPDVLVLDASPAPLYAAKHIPGAVSVDFMTYGFPERPLAETEQRYQAWGVSPGKRIVMYDQGGTFMATRLLFSLYHHGFPAEDLLILDGGLAKWEASGLTVTKDSTPAPAKGTFKIEKVREEVRVRLPEFLAASGDPVNNVLLEALDPDWHFGQSAFFGRPGHVPGAVMLPSADFFNADKTFKSPDEIRRMLAYFDIRPGQRIHAHCGGGLAASVPFFAVKFLLGYPRVTLYQESLMGWVSDERELPLWTYDAPHLLRDGTWLNAWAGQRLRSFRSVDISIVDVRSADAYGQGHVPFAVNVPAATFAAHLASPEALARVLGPAGISPSHETVIVSGAGLTKEAALAFVSLQRLGQKKVSILLDSSEKWTAQGLPVTKDPTAVRAPTGPRDIAVPPSAYAAALRGDVVTSDAAGTRALFPKVFVASGAQVPANSPDGKVVHVPYSTLLGADGAPKAASEIWAILAKAGVTRYAELICFADDPGEAAVNYVILELMGFPDVKLLAR